MNLHYILFDQTEKHGRTLSFEIGGSNAYSLGQCNIDNVYDEQPEICNKRGIRNKI